MNINTHIRLLLVPILSVVLFSCGESHFLKEEAYRNQVFQDFEQKQRALPHGDLFAIFSDSTLTLSEREALMFLYAYMPIGDITIWRIFVFPSRPVTKCLGEKTSPMNYSGILFCLSG